MHYRKKCRHKTRQRCGRGRFWSRGGGNGPKKAVVAGLRVVVRCWLMGGEGETNKKKKTCLGRAWVAQVAVGRHGCRETKDGWARRACRALEVSV